MIPRAYRYLLPALLIEVAFVFAPLAIGIYYSFHRVRFFELGAFTWFQNYADVLSSSAFVNSLLVTTTFALTATVLTFVVGFALAIFLSREGAPQVAIRAVVLIPYVIAMLVGSMLLKWILSSDAGLLSLANAWLSLDLPTILGDPDYAMAALVANGVWRDSAFAMILLLAGLKSISPTLIAAARIDGAGTWLTFRAIVLPLLRPTIMITLVRLLLHFTNVLTFAFILTGGGPNDATETLTLRIYRVGFQDYDLGTANAMAVILAIVNIVAVSLLVYAFRRRGRG
ncbi:MAG: sugar ABC transporter permease [Sneathiellaceae bacterium]